MAKRVDQSIAKRVDQSIAKHHHLPWFLHDRTGHNLVTVTIARPLHAPSTPGSIEGTWSTDVDAHRFNEMLKRAAAHAGYSARQRDLVEYRVRGGITLRILANAARQPERHHHAQHEPEPELCVPPTVRVVRQALIEARPMPVGGDDSLLVRTYRSDHVPFSSFPCDAQVQAATRIRRLELRVHANARLMFEVSSPIARMLNSEIRRVRLEINLSDVRGSDALHDLRRTVENTLHVVVMGMPRLVHQREVHESSRPTERQPPGPPTNRR